MSIQDHAPSIQDLAQILKARAVEGPLVLDERSLPSPRVRHLLAKLLGLRELVVQDAAVKLKGEHVQIKGRIDVLGVERAKATLELSGDHEAQELRARIELPEGWTFAESFPGAVGSPLESMAVTGAILAFDSATATAGTLVDALEFEAGVGAVEVAPALGSVLGAATRLRMIGSLYGARDDRNVASHGAIATELPSLDSPDCRLCVDLACSIPLDGAFGPVTLGDSELRLQGPWIADPEPRKLFRRVIGSTLRIGDRDLIVHGALDRETPVVNLRAETSNLPLTSLGELSGVFGPAQRYDLPNFLPSVGSPFLEAVELELSLEDHIPLRIGAAVRFAIDWDLLPQAIRTLSLVAEWLVVEPMGERKQYFTISTSTSFAAQSIDFTAEAPEWVLTGEMESVALVDLIDAVGGTAEGTPDLMLTDVEVSLELDQRTFAIRANSDDAWQFNVGPTEVHVSSLTVDIQRTQVADVRKLHGVISGEIALGFGRFNIECNVPGSPEVRGRIPEVDFSALLQEIAGGDLVRSVPLPTALMELRLTDVYLRIAPGDGSVSVAATSAFGAVEIAVQRADAEWSFTVGFRPPANWRLSNIAPELAPLDALSLARPTLILASHEGTSTILSTLQAGHPDVALHRDDLATGERAGDDVVVKRGLNLYANMGLAGTGLDEFLGLQALEVYAAISNRPSDMALEAEMEFLVELSSSVTFSRAKLRIRPAPAAPVITLLGELVVEADGDDLLFTAGLEVQPRSASLQATMAGSWANPFGLDSLELEDLAIDLGVTFGPILPTVGLAGKVRFGEVDAGAAVRFDTTNPGRSMLALSVERMSYGVLLRSLCPSVQSQLPQPFVIALDAYSYRDVDIYSVPLDTRIGELSFEAGLRAVGTLDILGLSATLDARFDPDSGVVATGSIGPIRAAGVFELGGLQGGPATVALDVRVGHVPRLAVQGRAALLGLSVEAMLLVEPTGVVLDAEGRIFNQFTAALHVTGKGLDDPLGWTVRATLQSQFMTYVREGALEVIAKAAEEATKKLQDARDEIQQAQKEVQRLDGTLKDVRATVKRERDRDAERLADAQRAVANAQTEVNKLNSQIKAARRTVEKERKRDTDRLRDAQKAVSSAQKDVDSIQREINSARGAIKRAKKKIKKKKSWLDGKAWYDKVWAGPEYAAYAAAQGTAIAARYTEIGTLEAARATANAVLEGAKQSVRGMELAATHIPVDADPRVAGLIGARTAAIGVLEAAKQAVRAMELAARTIPIDADPRVAGVIAARESANGVLAAANFSLGQVQAGVGAAADAASFIVAQGLGGLLDVRAASFQGALAGVSGGNVSLSISLSYLGRAPETLSLAFNFDDPFASVRRLAERLLAR